MVSKKVTISKKATETHMGMIMETMTTRKDMDTAVRLITTTAASRT